MIETNIKASVQTVARGWAIRIAIYAALVALAFGAALGGWMAHGWYSPRLENARLATKNCAGALEAQNQAVKDLGAKTADLTERLKSAQKKAATRRKAEDSEANKLLASVPPAGADRCDAASELIRRELGK